MKSLVQVCNTVLKIKLKLCSMYTADVSLECYISNRQLNSVSYLFHNVVFCLFVFVPALIILLLDCPASNNTVCGICWFTMYAAGATQAVVVGFYYPSDRDLLFAHVQTSAELLFCFYDHLCWVAMAPRPLAPKSNPVQCVEIPDVG